MDRSFDFILAGIALIVGIMLLTGHGDIFLKGGNTKLRKEKYDEKKMTKGSGVTLIYRFLHNKSYCKVYLYSCNSCDSCRICGIPEKEMHQEINTKIKQGMGDKNLPCLFCLREFIKKY